ncbi:MAG: sigma 54-interacting transcriptional regulator [Candidatus Coatesbacteria bacterium]|nr:sigma 54-interacting transcriptional regulator [Candidatus Coatesbacteria bacterium]
MPARYVDPKQLAECEGLATFAAEDEVTGSKVALKVLDERVCTPSLRLAFLRSYEQQSLMGLPAAPDVTPLEREGDKLFFATAFVHGVPFGANVSGEYEVAELLRLLFLAVSGLHSAGIIHGNLKPSNVLLTAKPKKELRLLDAGFWGYEAMAVQRRSSALFWPHELKTTGLADLRSDFFGFGLLAFEVVTGQAVDEKVLSGLCSRDRESAAAWLNEHAGGAHERLLDLIIGATSPSLIDRPQSCFELGELLSTALGQKLAPKSSSSRHSFSLCAESVGHQEALERLNELTAEARQRGVGIVKASGPPGSGKSRFLEEFLAECENDGLLAASCVCREMPLSPATCLLHLLESVAARTGRQHRESLQAEAAAMKESRWGIHSGHAGKCYVSALQRQSGILPVSGVSIQGLCETLRDEFWVFAIDDAHNLLASDVAVLMALLSRLQSQSKERRKRKGGLLLLLTVRESTRGNRATGESSRSLNYETALGALDGLLPAPQVETVSLGPIDAGSTDFLIRSILGSKHSLPALSSSLFDVIGGNAGWLSAGARAVCAQEGVPTPIDEKGKQLLEASPIRRRSFQPHRELAKALIGSLCPESVEVLEALAALPCGASTTLLDSVLLGRPGQFIRSTDDLCRRGVLSYRCTPSSVQVDFRHESFREVCSDSISKAKERETNRRAADYWRKTLTEEESEESATLAYHLARSDDGAGAVQRLEILAESFIATGDYRQATNLLEDAVAIFDRAASAPLGPSDLEQGIRLHCSLGDMYSTLSDYDRALSSYQKADSLADGNGLGSDRCGCLLRIGELHRLRGEPQKAIVVLDQAGSLARTIGDAQKEAAAAHGIGKAHWHLGKLEESLKSFRTALKCARKTKNEVERGAILHNIGSVFWVQGDYQQAMEHFSQARDICQKAGEEHMCAVATNSLGSVHAEQSEIAAAIDCFNEALTTFQRLGDRRNLSTTLQNIASSHFIAGEIGLALEEIDNAIQVKSKIGDTGGLATALSTRGEILREIGDVDGALRSRHEALRLVSPEKEPFISQGIRLQLGLDHLAAGNFESARYFLEESLNERADIRSSEATVAMLGLAELHLELEDSSRAIALCQEALSLLDQGKKAIGRTSCLITLANAYIRERRFDEASRCLKQAGTAVPELHAPFVQFQFYRALGRYHRRAGNPDESYSSYSIAASVLEGLHASLPEHRRRHFYRQRLIAHFLKGWRETKLGMDEDAKDKEPSQEVKQELSDEVSPVPPQQWEETTGPELTEVCDIILSHVLTATAFEIGCIAIRADSGRLQLTRARDEEGRQLEPKQIGQAAVVCRNVNTTGTPVFIHKDSKKPPWLPDQTDPKSVLCVPLVDKGDRLGALYLESPGHKQAPSDRTVEHVSSLARLAAKLIESALRQKSQNDYIKELLDRTRLLAGEDAALPMLVPASDSPTRKSPFPEMVGNSEALLQVAREASKVLKTDITVLITGETGTGKELLAQAIHTRSHRRDGPLVIINCGAIPRELVESELFGHEKGAFTDARRQKPGRLEYGDKGTIFLDEVGELSLDVQVKLLRFLETKAIERVGGAGQIQIDCRIVAATNRDLVAAVKTGEFREDLYYRLSVIHLELPPIRDRGDDILRMANHFLAIAREKHSRKKKIFSVKAVERMMQHSWPGNVRELQNRVEKAVLLSAGNAITAADLGLVGRGESQVPRLRDVKDDVEISRLKTALRASGGNVAQAARMIGLSRQNFYRLLKKHGLTLEQYRTSPDT